MNEPKLIIATNGEQTMALIDGVTIGAGIQRLDFSTENKDGEIKSTLRILDLDVGRAELHTDKQMFMDWVNGAEK